MGDGDMCTDLACDHTSNVNQLGAFDLRCIINADHNCSTVTACATCGAGGFLKSRRVVNFIKASVLSSTCNCDEWGCDTCYSWDDD